MRRSVRGRVSLRGWGAGAADREVAGGDGGGIGVRRPGDERGLLSDALQGGGVGDREGSRDRWGGFGRFAWGRWAIGDRSLFWHFPHYRGKAIPPYSMVRHGEFKLIKRYAGAPRYELFNVVDDISEEKDLAGTMPEKVTEMDKMIVGWCERQGRRCR